MLGLSELSNVQHPPRRLLLCHRHLKMLLLKQQAQAVNDRDFSEWMSSSSCQALGQWHGKGKHVPTVWSHHRRQGRDHWDQQSDPTATDDRREDAFTPTGRWGGRTHTGPGAGQDRRSQEIAGRNQSGGTSSPEQSDRSSMPSVRGDGRSGQDPQV